MQLQQKLDATAKEDPLNTIMASNVTSSLHSLEVTQALSNNILTQPKLAFDYGRSLMSTSLGADDKRETVTPCVSAIQSFSLDAGENPLTYRQLRTVFRTMFYYVALSSGDMGSCYSVVRGKDHSNTQPLALTDPEQMRAAIIQNAPILPGVCFMKGKLFEPHAKIAVASPLDPKTKQQLYNLGLYLSLNQFDGENYVQCTPTVMPLFFRQAMARCSINQMWAPLSCIQMSKMQTFSRGLFAKGYHVPPKNGIKYNTVDEICANMNTIYQNACQVTGVCPVIKGTGFSNASMLVY